MLAPASRRKTSTTEPYGGSDTIQRSRQAQTASSKRRRRRNVKLPQEIIDRIIDCLGDQQKLLVKCASVSRAFVRRSQQHIFAKIILFPSLEKRLEALLKKSPHLISYMREFTVAISTSRSAQRSPLIQILPLFNRLKSLSIKTYGGGVVDWERDVLKDLRDALASVFRENRLEEIVFQDIQNFNTQLPARCLSLRMLVIGGEGSLAPFTAQLQYPCRPPTLSVMMIGTGEDSLQSLMSCCTLASPAFTLDNLQWLGLRELPGRSWVDAFHELAQSSLYMLKHLVIELEVKSGDSRPELKDSPIDLSRLHSLTSIELRNNVYDYDQTPFSKRVAPILRSLPSPSRISQITLYCPGYEFATYWMPSCALQWQAVDEALSLSSNPSLRQIHFKFGATIFPTSPGLLPLASSRGVVTRVSKMMRAV